MSYSRGNTYLKLLLVGFLVVTSVTDTLSIGGSVGALVSCLVLRLRGVATFLLGRHGEVVLVGSGLILECGIAGQQC